MAETFDYLRRLASERSQNAKLAAAEGDFRQAVVQLINSQVRNLEEVVASREDELRSLKASLAGEKSEIRSIRDNFSIQARKIEQLESDIAARDSSITGLSQERTDRNGLGMAFRALFSRRSSKWARRLVSCGRIPVRLLGVLFMDGSPVSFKGVLTDGRILLHIQTVLRSGLFDRGYYARSYPDVAEKGVDLLTHYLIRGVQEGRNPNALFDTTYYRSQNPDVDRAGINPLLHYLIRGSSEGRDPHPLFDSSYYLEQNPDVASASVNPLAHYLLHGANEGRDPHPLFDSKYYLRRNSGEISMGVNPLVHYLNQGAGKGCDPHPLFDTSYYLEQNPDVAKAAANPLVHYLFYGAYEGRDPHPLFDSSYYLEQNSDVANAHLNPLIHYLVHGFAEGRDPNQWFDTSKYLEDNPAVGLKGLNPLVHFLSTATGFDLRVALREEFRESGRSSLDSSYDLHPLVSVIIPCFNQAHLLEDAVLSSLLACSLPVEVIVVDDGSTDPHSAALIDELAEKYRFTLIRQPNAGRVKARNAGIRQSRGEFIQFLDADDLLVPESIDVQVREMRANPAIDICVSEYELCDADGLQHWMNDPSTISGFSFSKNDFSLLWKKGFYFPIHCALLRRQKLQIENCNLPSVKGDQDFWLGLLPQSPSFTFNPTVLAIKRLKTRELSRYVTGAPRGRTRKNLQGPRVSVVIRCYNYGRYLDEAIQSVLNQTYQDFEIVLIDDGSTDPETIRILNENIWPKTRLISTSNQGLSAALNNGITAAEGKYILALDADDKIANSYLEKAIRTLEENKEVGIVYCKAELFGDSCGPWELQPFRYPDILLGNQIFVSAVFHRSDWEEVGGYDTRMIYGWEDYDFWLSLLELGRQVYCIPETLMFYRKHRRSTVSKMKREHFVYSYAQLFRNHAKLYMDNLGALLNERPERWYELQGFIQANRPLRDPQLRLVWDVIRELVAGSGEGQVESAAGTTPIE